MKELLKNKVFLAFLGLVGLVIVCVIINNLTKTTTEDGEEIGALSAFWRRLTKKDVVKKDDTDVVDDVDDVDDGGFSIRITIDSNDPIVEVFEFLVTGFIELEEVEVVDNITDETIMTNATVDFGSTQLGSPVARSFTLFNPSTLETLEIEEMIIESDGFELIEEPTLFAL